MPIRVLIAKPGLDGRITIVARRSLRHRSARGLRDAGMEVIYTGLRQTPDPMSRPRFRLCC